VTTASHSAHSVEELCTAGTDLYERALREGRVRCADADSAPCLVDFGLLHPAVEDLSRLEPAAPAVALHRLLRISEDLVADERRRAARLAETFEPLMRIDGRRTAAEDTPTIRVLSGTNRINQAIAEAMTDVSREACASSPTPTTAISAALPPSPSPWTATRPCWTAAAVSAPSTSTRSATHPSSSPATNS
jgi:hypothetical protein